MVRSACLREIWELADEKSERLLIPRVGCHSVCHALPGEEYSWGMGWPQTRVLGLLKYRSKSTLEEFEIIPPLWKCRYVGY